MEPQLATIITKAFFLCPRCEYEFSVQHLLDQPELGTTFRWICGQCNHQISFEVSHQDRQIRITEVTEQNLMRLALLRLRDLYVVVEKYGFSEESYDYLFHSHQCPTNIMHEVMEVVDAAQGTDPHGIFRYVASLPDSTETRKQLHNVSSLEAVFRLFSTDGAEAPTEWPERDGGVSPVLADLRRQQKQCTVPKA